jgi:hypothetical protein
VTQGLAAAAIVVKLQALDHPLVPMAFLARTRQKTFTPYGRESIVLDAVVSVESLIRTIEKLLSRDTCTWYVAAPLTVDQTSVGLLDWFTLLLTGETSVGTDGMGGATVVKFHGLAHTLTPAAFFARTRQ